MSTDNKGKFKYSYSAPTEEERREIESIKREYGESRGYTSKLDEIRKYDKRVKGPAQALSLCAGVIGLLIFGLGMTMVLEWSIYIGGIPIALIGLITLSLAYPVYNYFIRTGRKKYGEKILTLLEELEANEG